MSKARYKGMMPPKKSRSGMFLAALMFAVTSSLGIFSSVIATGTTTINEPTIYFESGTPTVEVVDKDGTGALFISTPDNTDKAQVFVTSGMTLGDLETLAYRTYREAGAGQQIASLNITLSPWAGTFVYEPVYDTTVTVEDDQWQEWDAFSEDARWWNSNDPNTFVSWSEITDGFEDDNVAAVLVNQGSGNAGLISYVDYVEVNDERFDFEPLVIEGEIISPSNGEVVSGTLELEANYTGDPNDPVFWAVRLGTCDANQGTVLGNVDGSSDDYTWEDGVFSASHNVSGFEPGEYCFVFNPGGNQNDVRETVEFTIKAVEEVDSVAKDECKKGGWADFGFFNQGQCIRFVNTGQDSR